MYKITCDDFVLHYPVNSELIVNGPNINLELCKAGSLSFSINPTHPYYSKINKMQSVISVYKDNSVIFKGRVFSDNVDFYKNKKVEVEGILAYFNDSVVMPYAFSGSVEDYLKFLINQHNEQVSEKQRFKCGTVTVTDPNDYIVRSNSSYPNTWNEIEEKLIKKLGGYLYVRYTDNGNCIDYLADMPNTSMQDIRFAVNLLDLESNVSGETISTCLIPYGAKIEGESSDKRIDITSVNNGVYYIADENAVAKYGKIYEVVYFDDVTLPENLLKKAQLYLKNKVLFNNSLQIKAVDLNLADENIAAFKLGDKIQVYSEPHNIKETMLIYSYSVTLTDPTSFVFTVNREKNSLLDSQIGVERQTSENVERIDKAYSDIYLNKGKIEQVNEKVNSVIQEQIENYTEMVQNSQQIILEAVKDYVKTSDYEIFKETIETQLTQTAENITISFNSLQQVITEENGEINRQLTEISKYIRFDDGNIILGQAGNPMETVIENGRISYRYNGIEVMYISDGKMYIANIEVLSKLIIGNFGWIPRSNGHLCLKKIK